MTKEERYQYLDVLAVEAKTDASARELICRHFKKYIHHLSCGKYENWSREDAEQDLWVCFLECLLSFDPSKGIHFTKYVMKRLKWSRLNMTRDREVEKKKFISTGGIDPEVPDDHAAIELSLTAKEIEAIISSCPLTSAQRKLLDQRMEGKAWREIAEANHTSFSGIYRHARNIRHAFVRNYNFQETFVG